MLWILRQLSPEERCQVAIHCGCRPDALPDEVIRATARTCGLYQWGIFPIATADVLLDQLGRRLGMPPLVPGARALYERERAVLAYYLRQAWESAPVDRREQALRMAHSLWDNPRAPRPELPVEPLEELEPQRLRWQAVLEAMLQQASGCRTLAVVQAQLGLALPPVPTGLRALIPGAMPTTGHQAIFGVFGTLWRARARLLRERRVHRAEMERQLRHCDSLLSVRQKHLRRDQRAWVWNPVSGLALAAAGGVSTVLYVATAAAVTSAAIPAACVGAAGLLWSGAALALGPRPPVDERALRLTLQARALRQQLGEVERQIAELETE